MIKLIPVPNITKRELMKALMDGRRFHIGDEFKDACIVHWDDNFGDIPVRIGLMHWRFRGFKYLHEITESHWYDNIPEEGVLCWVGVNTMMPVTRVPLLIVEHDPYLESAPLKAVNGEWYSYNITPVQPADIYQEPV